MKSSKLSALCTKGSASIICSKYVALSPCIGLLSLNMPSLIVNLRTFKSFHFKNDDNLLMETTELSKFIKEMFYQREHKCSIHGVNSQYYAQRYGPIVTVNSRSLPLYWLNPSELGQLLGIALLNVHHNGKLSNKEMDKLLLELNIECNHYRGNSTGVSLERYRKIIKFLSKDLEAVFPFLSTPSAPTSSSSEPFQGYGLPIYLAYLWEKSNEKGDLLAFLKGIESTSKLSIIEEGHANLRCSDSDESRVWCTDNFTMKEVHIDNVSKALSTVFNANNDHRDGDGAPATLSFAKSLELLCANTALEKAMKPALKLGRYAFSGGAGGAASVESLDNASTSPADTDASRSKSRSSEKHLLRPDCVEVVVREIIDNLIFDGSRNKLCLELLPASAHPRLLRFYQDLASGIISDIPNVGGSSSGPSMQPRHRTKVAVPLSVPDNRAMPSNDRYYDKTNNTAGQAWFDLCSNLPNCDYLSELPTSDAPYELTPTRSNVLKVLQRLLTCGGGDDEGVVNSSQWGTFKDFEKHCNEQPPLIGDGFNRRERVSASDSILLFRAPFSDTEKITREVTRIRYWRTNIELVVDLEVAHGLASVKYQPVDRSKLVRESKQVSELMQRIWLCELNNHGTIVESDRSHMSCLLVPKLLLLSTYLGESMVFGSVSHIQQLVQTPSAVTSPIALFLHAVFACPLGQERSHLTPYSSAAAVDSSLHGDAGGNGVMSSRDALLKREYNFRVYLKLLELILLVSSDTCNNGSSVSYRASLIAWILSELPGHASSRECLAVARTLRTHCSSDHCTRTLIISYLLQTQAVDAHQEKQVKSARHTNTTIGLILVPSWTELFLKPAWLHLSTFDKLSIIFSRLRVS